MDDTQRLQFDDEDEEVSLGNKDRPVGNLHMFAGVHGPAQDFPIYLGQNLIGRHASCDITLPAQSVSKKHAILEVKGDCHTICDNGSLNKTRRCKAALTPNVRYALSDGDFLLFADVACRYSIEKRVEEPAAIEDSEDDSVLVPGTQGALAIEKTPGVAIRRMVRGAVLAMDSGDEDEEGEAKRKYCERGHGLGSYKHSSKSSSFGANISPITDTFVPESDEESEISLSESHIPSLNLRCDSETDTHETPTKGEFLIPTSVNIVTPPSLKSQLKDDSKLSEPANKEKKNSGLQADEAKILTSTKVGSAVKEDQEREQKAEAVSGDGGGNVQVVASPETLSAKPKESTNLNIDQNETKEIVSDKTKEAPVSKSTSNPCVKDGEDPSLIINVVQSVSDERNPVNNDENNVKPLSSEPRVDTGFSIDSDTDVDEEEDVSTSQSDIKEAKTIQDRTNQDEAHNKGLDSVASDADFCMEDAATSGSELESAKTGQENLDSRSNEDSLMAAHPDQSKSDSDGNHDGDTGVEDVQKTLKSQSENDHPITSATKKYVNLELDSDSDVEDTKATAEPEEKNFTQDPESSKEEKKEGFHLDSDTDVEEDVSTVEGKKEECPTSITVTEIKGKFHLDSDTDVEEDASTTEVKKDEWTTSISVTETKDELHLDSDTDVDEDVDNSSRLLTKEEQDCKPKIMNVQEAKDGVHLDSDTDVDEDDFIPGASNAPLENRQISQIPTQAPEKVEMEKSDGLKDELDITNKEASGVHMDDDTDVDEEDALPGASIVEEARTMQETTKHEQNEVDVTNSGAAVFHVDSDTDVEEGDAPVMGLEKGQASEDDLLAGATEDHDTGKASVSTSGDHAAVSCNLNLETSRIPAEDPTEEEESQKSDSENANYELMATQCYLEPQEQESESPDEEEATQAYAFSSTWAEPDPFKRPADPISVLQISAVTVNSSEDEIDDTALAETQPYFAEVDSPEGRHVPETPELGNDSVGEQDPTQPADRVEEASEDVQPLSCATVSQEDTQPVSQCLTDRPPPEAGYWLHLKRDVPASVWVKSVQCEDAASDPNEVQDNEGDRETNEADKVPAMELKVSPPATPDVPAVEEQPAQAPTPDVPPAEEANMEPGVTALPPTEDDATQPYNLETQDADDQPTQAQSVPDCSDTQIISSHVQGDDVQPPEINAGVSESDDTQPGSSLSAQAGQGDANEASNKGKGKQPARKGLSRSRKRGESRKDAQTAEEIVEATEQLVSDSLPERLNSSDNAMPKQSAPETKEEPKAEKGGSRRGRRGAAADVEEKMDPKEEAVSTSTRKRTSKTASKDEPTTTGVTEKVKRRKLAGASSAHETKEDSEGEEKPEPITEESKVTIDMPQVGKDNLVKCDSEKEDEAKGNEDKVSVETIDREDPVISDGNACKPLSTECSSDLPNTKRTTLRRRGAIKQKKVDTIQAESKDDGDKTVDENLSDHKPKVQDQGEQKKPTSRLVGADVTDDEGLEKIESLEQKTVQDEDSTAGLRGQNEEELRSGMENSRRLRRSLTEEFKAESEQLELAERSRPGRSTSTRGGAKKTEDQEGKGKSDANSKSSTTQRRTKRSKEEAAIPEVANVEKIEEGDPAKKPRRTRKNLKDEQKTETDIGGTEDSKTSEGQITSRTRRKSKEEESVTERAAVKETRRSLRGSKDEDVTNMEDQSKKSARTRNSLKEDVNTEQKHEETKKEDSVLKRTTLRSRGNLNVDTAPGANVKQTKSTSKSERCSPRTRRKALMVETEKVPGESERTGGPVEEAEERQDVETKKRLSSGRGRRTAAKEEIPQVSTPDAARKRGQTTKPEVEVKRKKADAAEEVKEDLVVVETPPSRRGRPRKLAVAVDTSSADGKGLSPPDPSPSRSSSRQRPTSASSTPTEARTPRRTSRASALTTASSPYTPHSGLTPKVLFTGVVDAAGEEVIRSLGGDIADSVFDCTHLVTDRVRRTVKFLCALARGIPIVTLDWIEKCKKSRCFLSPAGFLVHDKEQEKNFNFVLSESLQKAKRRPLFEGYEIHITPNVKPEPEHMKEILQCSGATFLPKAPRTCKEKCVVVSCPEDTARCKSVPKSVPITTAEFILSGILRQEVNPAAYLLNAAAEAATPTLAKRRR